MSTFINYQKYHLGKKIAIFFFLKHAQIWIVIAAFFSFCTYSTLYGFLGTTIRNVLDKGEYSFLPTETVALWFSLLAFSFVSIAILRTWVWHRQFSFMLDEKALHIKHGIFTVKEYVIAYHQIQNIEVRSPYFLRPFGIVHFDIILGNEMHPQDRRHKKDGDLIPYMDKKQAKALARELIHRGGGGNIATRNNKLEGEIIPNKKRKRRR